MDYQKLKALIPKNSNQWNVQDVRTWLHFIDLERFSPNFEALNINGTNLVLLNDEILKSNLNISSNIVRKKLMKWIEKGLKQFDLQNSNYLPDRPITQRTKKDVNEIANNHCLAKMEQEKTQDEGKFQLIFQHTINSATVYYFIEQEGGKIGRHTSNKICITNEEISREHAEVGYQNKLFYILDCGSNGGTYIKLQGSMELTEGLSFEIGSFEFTVCINNHKMCLMLKYQNQDRYMDITIPSQTQIKIGRNGDKGFNFPGDSIMSNVHCFIQNLNGKLFILDNGSTNGTWLRLSKQNLKSAPFYLADNTTIRIGDTMTFTVYKQFVTKKAQKKYKDICSICYDSQKDCVYLPCKHHSSCVKCSRYLRACPMCRQPIQEVMKIYYQ